jgi:hypothetical protein
MQDLSPEALRRLIEDAALVVPCLGYRSATLPVFDEKGHRLALRADANAAAVSDDCRMLIADETKLSNIFGIGLGSGFRPGAEMGCEPNFSGQANSLWLYQNDIGALIFQAIRTQTSASQSA